MRKLRARRFVVKLIVLLLSFVVTDVSSQETSLSDLIKVKKAKLLESFSSKKAWQSFRFSKSGNLFAIGYKGELFIYEIPSLTIKSTIVPCDKKELFFRVSFEESDKLIMVICSRGWFRTREWVEIWDAERGEKLKSFQFSFKEVYGFPHLSSDGKRMIVRDSDSKVVELWDVENGRKISDLVIEEEKKEMRVLDMAFSPDGKTVAVAYRRAWIGTQIYLWDAESGRVKHLLVDNTLDSKIPISGNYAFTFTKDSKYLISYNLLDQTRIWDVKTGNLVRKLTEGAEAVAVSSDGKKLVMVDEDDKVQVRDLDSWELIWKAPKSMKFSIYTFRLSQDENKLYVHSSYLGFFDDYYKLYIWDLEKKKLIVEDSISSGKFELSSDFKYFALARGSRTIELYELVD